MAIRSKTNWPPSIQIAGVSWWGRINVAADLAYGMAPAIDADAMFKELGAMVTDIQTLGDHGIQKWLQIERNSIAKAANTSQAVTPNRIISMRYAMAAIVLIGLFVSSESIWYANGAKKMLAVQMRQELANARNSVEKDTSVKVWVPKLLVSAEQEAVAGETAFQGTRFTDAIAHWKVAINAFANIPNVALAMKNASQLQSQYKTNMNTVYLQEAVSERLNPASMMSAFTTLIGQHPTPNQPWQAVKQSATEARGLDVLEAWTQVENAWGNAASGLPQAYRLMHADILVKQAENEIKNNNANAAIGYTKNAIIMVPGYSPALQRKELAENMAKYDEYLRLLVAENDGGPTKSDTLTEGEEMPGNNEWIAVRANVGNARDFAQKNEWDKSNDEWKNALNKMPGVILIMRLDMMETAARRGNWKTVSTLASKIMVDNPDHLRANQLKKKVDGILSARSAELAYQKTMSDVLRREVESDYIKTGDMTDFIAHMDKYGQEEWAQVKDSVNKAEAFGLNEQGIESSNEWSKAYTLFPSAVHRVRAEIWMEQADLAVKSNNWTKVLIYAENALREKPDHVRAKQLRDQADLIEKKRLMQTP